MIDFLKGAITPKDWMAVATILGVTAAIVAGFFFLVHSNQKHTLATVTAEDLQVHGDLARAQTIDREIDDLREETAQIEELVSEFEERLPSRREIPSLLKEFERMAAEEDIDVELSPMPRSRDERKEIIPFTIVARGTFHEVTSFINRLERFKRYLKVSDLEIGPSVKGTTTARFTLNTYRFLQSNTGIES